MYELSAVMFLITGIWVHSPEEGTWAGSHSIYYKRSLLRVREILINSIFSHSLSLRIHFDTLLFLVWFSHTIRK